MVGGDVGRKVGEDVGCGDIVGSSVGDEDGASVVGMASATTKFSANALAAAAMFLIFFLSMYSLGMYASKLSTAEPSPLQPRTMERTRVHHRGHAAVPAGYHAAYGALV